MMEDTEVCACNCETEECTLGNYCAQCRGCPRCCECVDEDYNSVFHTLDES